MNVSTLNEFRHEVYGCLKRAGDALFNTVDALSSETAAHSFPELSLSPFFQRKWASLYEAFEDGQINRERLRQVFVHFAPLPKAGQSVFLGIDTSNLYRPAATTSPDRTMVPLPNLPECDHAVCLGWVISSVVLLPEQAGQGTFVLDTQRVTSSDLATQMAASQLRAVVDLLVQRGLRPVIIGDRWYACAPFLARMTDVAASCLLHLKRNRVLYRRAPTRLPGQRGASRKDGARFQCSDESTHGEADASWEGTDAKGKRVEVRCWNQLHLRTARGVQVSVIRVIRHGASERRRDPKISWCVWKGDEPDLSVALLARTWVLPGQTDAALRRAPSAHSSANRTLDASRRLRTQPVGSGPSPGRRDLSTLGNASLGSDVGASSMSHAHPFDAVGNPGTTAATTRESARTRQGLPTETRSPSSGHSQNKQKAEKAHNGDFALSHIWYGSARPVLV